jgi:hypothetical protein
MAWRFKKVSLIDDFHTASNDIALISTFQPCHLFSGQIISPFSSKFSERSTS